MLRKLIRKDKLFYILTAVIFAGGLFFWSYQIEADPPMYFSGLGQSLSTDAPQYVYHARNKILFDDFDPFDYPRWTVYQHSLTSLVGYLWFTISEPSLKNANIVGLFFVFGALLLFLFGMYKKQSGFFIFLFSFFYLSNVVLFTHGRLSYLENGLLFLTAALFFVCVRWGDKIYGMIICGLITSLAMLVGKLFGVLLLPALLVTIYLRSENNRIKNGLITLASFVVTTLGVAFLLYGTDLTAAFGYVGEQSYGLRGFPVGLSSPWDFVIHLVSYGYLNRLFILNIDLSLFFIIGAFLLFVFKSSGKSFRDLPPASLFSLFWIIFVILGLMPLNYSPIRYTLFLIPAFLIFSLSLIEEAVLTKESFTKPNMFGIIFFGYVLWHTLFQVIALIFYKNFAPFHPMTWGTLPVVMIVVYYLRNLVLKNKFTIPKYIPLIFVISLIALSLGVNSYRFYEHHFKVRNYNLEEASIDLGKVLNREAVISGPYAAALTMNNSLKSFIHLFGVAEVDSSLFDRYPITHLALDESNLAEAVKNYPRLKDIKPICSYWIRDYDVKIYNISGIFNNSEAARYKKTDFEKAANFVNLQIADSAGYYLNRFREKYKESKAGEFLAGNLLFMFNQIDQSFAIFKSLADRYPTDYSLRLQYGYKLQVAAVGRKDKYLLTEAQKQFQRATELNPYRADYATNIWQKTLRQGNPNQGK